MGIPNWPNVLAGADVAWSATSNIRHERVFPTAAAQGLPIIATARGAAAIGRLVSADVTVIDLTTRGR